MHRRNLKEFKAWLDVQANAVLPKSGRDLLFLGRSRNVNKVNPLTCLTQVLSDVRNQSVTLLTPDEFMDSNIAHVG